jgi:hypothetical protein
MNKACANIDLAEIQQKSCPDIEYLVRKEYIRRDRLAEFRVKSERQAGFNELYFCKEAAAKCLSCFVGVPFLSVEHLEHPGTVSEIKFFSLKLNFNLHMYEAMSINGTNYQFANAEITASAQVN